MVASGIRMTSAAPGDTDDYRPADIYERTTRHERRLDPLGSRQRLPADRQDELRRRPATATGSLSTSLTNRARSLPFDSDLGIMPMEGDEPLMASSDCG